MKMYVLQHTKNMGSMGGMDLMPQHRASVTSSLASLGDFSQESDYMHQQKHRQGPYLEGNMKLLATVECPEDVMCTRFSDDGSLLAVGLVHGCINIHEMEPLTCTLLHSLTDDDTINSRLPVTQIRFKHFESGDKPEHKRVVIATYASGMIKYWHYTTKQCLHTINEPDSQLLTLAVNPENTLFCTSGEDPRIHLYDMATQKKLSTLEASDGRDMMDGHQCRVFALMYHPKIPHVFISGGWDDTVQYWDDRMKHAQKHISGPHICGDAIDIDPNYNHILTGSWRSGITLQIWDFNTGQKIKDVPPQGLNNDTMVYCCQWLGYDSIIAGGHNHNMARMIDRGTLNTTGQLVDLPQSVYCLDNDRKGNHPRVAIGSQNYIYIVREEKKGS